MRILVLAILALPLAACADLAGTVQSGVADGQLFCAVGQSVVALQAVTGNAVAPVIAKGASSQFVTSACAVVDGIAVVPPATPDAAPVLVIPAMSLPLSNGATALVENDLEFLMTIVPPAGNPAGGFVMSGIRRLARGQGLSST